MELIKKNVLEAWKSALRTIVEQGIDFTDNDGRICKEIINFTIVIEDPWNDLESPIDQMQQYEFIYPAKEELLAIIMNKDEVSGYDYSYGPRIFGHPDQIHEFIIPLLKKDPHTRRAIVSLFDPAKDSSLNSKNIPSLMYLHFKIVQGKLALTCYIRSNDFFIGWPGNIYQIGQLQKYVAEKLSVLPGSLTTISGSAHLFHEHLELINKILEK